MIEETPKITLPVEIHFRVSPRDWTTKNILLASQTIHALNNAAKNLKALSNDQYELVLTRGYVYWGKWRRIRGQLAKIIFYIFYWTERADAELLFGHNGHNDGLSVDVQLFDIRSNQLVQWLSWKNILIPRAQAIKILQANRTIIHMLDTAMRSANFIVHTDPREKLQMHYRLNLKNEKLQLISVMAASVR